MTVPTEAILRSMLQDPSGASEILATTDYDVIIAIEDDNVYRAAAMAARMIAATFAQKIKVAAGSIKADLDEKYQHYIDLAKNWDFRAREGGGGSGDEFSPQLTGVSLAEIETVRDDTDRPPSSFEMGFQDNPPFAYTGAKSSDESEEEE